MFSYLLSISSILWLKLTFCILYILIVQIHITNAYSTIYTCIIWPFAGCSNIIFDLILFGLLVFMDYINISTIEFTLLSVWLILKFWIWCIYLSKYVNWIPNGSTYNNQKERNGNLLLLSSIVCTYIPSVLFTTYCYIKCFIL